MIKRLQTILIACLIAVTAWAAGDSVKEYKSVDDVPNVRLTDVRRYVSDPTSILAPAATDTIDVILGRLEKSTGIETAVVMLPSIGENDIFDFSTSLFRKWGIGKKKSDNGHAPRLRCSTDRWNRKRLTATPTPATSSSA